MADGRSPNEVWKPIIMKHVGEGVNLRIAVGKDEHGRQEE
jgi:hypothetical protein